MRDTYEAYSPFITPERKVVRYHRTVAPTSEPVTRDQLKRHLRVDTDDDNDLIDSFGIAARERLEELVSLNFMPQTWVGNLDRFPFGWTELRLDRLPIQSVTSIQYIDTAQVTQTWDPSLYQLSIPAPDQQGRLMPIIGQPWPIVYPRQLDGVTITMKLGFSSSTDPETARAAVPVRAKQIIKLMAWEMYYGEDLSKTIDPLVDSIRWSQ